MRYCPNIGICSEMLCLTSRTQHLKPRPHRWTGLQTSPVPVVCSLIGTAPLWSLTHGNRFTWQMIKKCRCLECCELVSFTQLENVCVISICYTNSAPKDLFSCVSHFCFKIIVQLALPPPGFCALENNSTA